jgi:hypothetical protein
VADNGSDDESVAISAALGARVVEVPIRGYGAAIDAGIRASNSEYVIIADGDLSYDFSMASDFYLELKKNNLDLVIGNRFRGGISKGAMPPLHKFLGNPILSFIARTLFSIPIGDFHCGMRAIRRSMYLKASPRTKGMEFATEMVLRMVDSGAHVREIPTTLVPDGRNRKPHLRSFPDGWRHLKLMLLFAPQFLFLAPGLIIFLLGGILLGQFTITGKISLGFAESDILGGLCALVLVISGVQFFTAGAVAVAFAKSKGLKSFKWLPISYSRNRAVIVTSIPVLMIVSGVIGFCILAVDWFRMNFGHIDPLQSTRIGFISSALLVTGINLLIGAIQVRQTISKFW